MSRNAKTIEQWTPDRTALVHVVMIDGYIAHGFVNGQRVDTTHPLVVALAGQEPTP